MRPVFMSALIILTHMAIKSYDLVLSVTGKNPGGAAELPSTFMYSYTFTRNQMAVGSTSAVIMLMTIAAIMVPYLYSELQGEALMSAADLVTAAPSREPARHSMTTRVVIYGLLDPVRDRLPRAARRHGDDVAEAARRGHRRQHVLRCRTT